MKSLTNVYKKIHKTRVQIHVSFKNNATKKYDLQVFGYQT